MIIIDKCYIENEESKGFLKANVTISMETIDRYKRLSKKLKKVHWRTDIDYPSQMCVRGGEKKL